MPCTTELRCLLAVALTTTFASPASAKPRRVVILDFDGPRSLADAGRTEVVSLLEDQYDVVAKTRWEQARVAAQKRSVGPQTWNKAAKTAGVDAVIEGWVQDEGRHKLLTIAVREAVTGHELDTVSVRIGPKGLSEDGRDKLQSELDGVLAYIEGAPEPLSTALPVIDTRTMIGARGGLEDPTTRERRRSKWRVERDTDGDGEIDPRPAEARDEAPQGTQREADERDGDRPRRRSEDRDRDDEGDRRDEFSPPLRSGIDSRPPAARSAGRFAPQAPPGPLEFEREDDAAEDVTAAKALRVTPVTAAARDPEDDDLVSLFGAQSEEGKIADPGASHAPTPSPRFQFSAGVFYGSRSLSFASENPDGVTSYLGVPGKGLGLRAAAYPFPTRKHDGGLSGVGFTASVAKVAGSEVSFDDGDTVTEYVIDHTTYDVGVHYRAPVADLVTIDGSLTYGRFSYVFPDAPPEYEVPDVGYSYVGLGAHLDLNVTTRASVGFGARYLHILDVGDISADDWYGPGRASGLGLAASAIIPLPRNVYLQGALDYQRVKITFDGVGVITEDEAVQASTDATVKGSLDVGVQF